MAQRNPNDPVRVFYVRADKDNGMCQELDTHLALLRRENPITKRPPILATWNPESAEIGERREADIRGHLDQAEIAVAFISPHLWVSERYGDLVRAWELREAGKLRLMPIIARAVPSDHDLSELAALPRRGGPLDGRSPADRDTVYVEIVEELKKAALTIQAQGTVTTQAGSWSQRDLVADMRRKATLYSGPVPLVATDPATVREGLEKVVRATNQFQDIARWNARLGRIQRQVCKVQTPTTSGTGFLIGPDLVLTNYHVIEDLVATPSHAGFASVLFDDAAAVTGTVAVDPRKCELRKDWLLDHKKYSQQEKTGPVDPEKVLPDELDYAVLRLSQSPGDDVVARTAAGEPILRGWLAGQSFPFLPGSPLFIVQHPEGAPMKLALDTDAVVRLSSNGLRVTYRTNTEPGSSGAPCFNQQWDLVALHHHGTTTQNQGIPIMKIMEEIAKKVRLQAPPP